MEITQELLNFIKKNEGCRLEAYQDSGGTWSIGYGRTLGVKKGDTITQEQAEAYLKEDVSHFAASVTELVKVEINENQFISLVDFTYNLGIEAFAKSTLLKLLNEKNFEGAANEFPKWDHAGPNHEVIQGLLNRREAEKKLFLTSIVVIAAATKPTPVFKPGQNIYTIQSGDTLTYISQKYHVPVSILARYNDIENPDVIDAGDKLKIPKSVEVRSGDVLSEIARRNDENLEFIVKVNAIENPNLIYIGQTIWV